ncbi:MAG: FecR domain-containing protein, partial [Hyphomicrobiaceae bacterium]
EGNAVHYRERLVAGPKSTGQFVLGDNTKIALGPGAQLRLDNVVLGRSRRTARAVGLRLVQGAMRFATGFSRKRVYRINAAAATIGVRGTIFDAFTLGRLTAVILLQGELRVCLGRRNCRVLRNRCDWVVIGPDGRLARPRGRISNRRLGFPISHAFPFLHRDSRLNPGLKAGGSGCASPTGFTPLVPDSWSNRDPFLAPERSDGNGRRTDAGDDGQRDDGGSDGGSDGGGYDDGGESK